MAKETEIYTVIDLNNLANTKSFKTKKKVCEYIGIGIRGLANVSLPTTVKMFVVIESSLLNSDRIGNIKKLLK